MHLPFYDIRNSKFLGVPTGSPSFETANRVRLQSSYIKNTCSVSKIPSLKWYVVRWFMEVLNALNFKNRVANAEIGISYLAVYCNSAIARTGNCANNFEWVNPQFCGLLPQVTQKDDILKHKSLRSVNMYTYILIKAWCQPPPTLTDAPFITPFLLKKWVLLSISNMSIPYIMGYLSSLMNLVTPTHLT